VGKSSRDVIAVGRKHNQELQLPETAMHGDTTAIIKKMNQEKEEIAKMLDDAV
jgi:hypothetical protein